MLGVHKVLHLTAFPLRSKAAGELGRYVSATTSSIASS
jgi:hypothetical protein